MNATRLISALDYVINVAVLFIGLFAGAAVMLSMTPARLTASIATPIALFTRPPMPSQWDREIVTVLALRGCTQLAGELCGDHAGCYGQKLERCLWH